MLHKRGEVKIGSESDFKKVADLQINISQEIIEDIKVSFIILLLNNVRF